MDTIITTLIDGVLVPLIDKATGSIPFLISSGILLVLFGALWVAFAAALLREPKRIDKAWRWLRKAPLVVQAVAWVLFLPVLAGVWIYRTSWPATARLALVGGLAGWNLFMFLP